MNLLAFLDTCGSWQIWMLIISFLALHSLLVVFVIDSFITCLCIRLRKIKEEKEKKLLLLHPPPTEEQKQPPTPKPKPMKPTKEKKPTKATEEKPTKDKEEKKLTKDKEKPAKEVEIKPVNLASGLYENCEAAKEKTPPKEERPKESTARSSRDIAPPPPPPSPPPEEKKSKSDVKIKREIKILPIMVKKKEKKKKDKKKPKKKKPSERSSTSGESGSDTKTEKPAKETKGRTVIQASLKNFFVILIITFFSSKYLHFQSSSLNKLVQRRQHRQLPPQKVILREPLQLAVLRPRWTQSER
uniref:Uncharacterized protein n=1 Tax=Meloidogyne enterolobii TaxID=390850 RepID=A0A6V7XUN0_MELEN|nr:unnamed protein product [Meloidogyne enterolobii]